MRNRFFSYMGKFGVFIVKYAFFLFNLALLVGLGVKTANLWIADSFDFSDTLTTFSDEPELINRKFAEFQLWFALSVESILYVFGSFLCYETLIRPKTLRRSLIAPLAVAFLWTVGESVPLFLPATEKVAQINACKAMDISWDTQNHMCRLMDLELKRFEQIMSSPARNTSLSKKETPLKKEAPVPPKLK